MAEEFSSEADIGLAEEETAVLDWFVDSFFPNFMSYICTQFFIDGSKLVNRLNSFNLPTPCESMGQLNDGKIVAAVLSAMYVVILQVLATFFCSFPL